MNLQPRISLQDATVLVEMGPYYHQTSAVSFGRGLRFHVYTTVGTTRRMGRQAGSWRSWVLSRKGLLQQTLGEPDVTWTGRRWERVTF